MASFTVPIPVHHGKGSKSISSSDVILSEYLAAKVEYSNLVLRPILIVDKDSTPLVAHPELLGNATAAYYRQAYYHVEILSDDFNSFSLSDALNAGMALLEISENENMFLIPIEPTDILGQSMDRKTLLYRRNTAVGLPDYYYDDGISWTRSGYGYERQNLIWMLATTLAEDEELLYAALFIREAIRDFQFLSRDDVIKTIHESEQHPDTISDGVRIENAIHNCYKAIEAIHGGNLPQNEVKIVKSFQKFGIDLTEMVGYKYEENKQQSAIEKIINLRNSRNFKSAHGRIGANRKSTFYELMDFQQLARYLVLSAINQRAGVNILHPVIPEQC